MLLQVLLPPVHHLVCDIQQNNISGSSLLSLLHVKVSYSTADASQILTVHLGPEVSSSQWYPASTSASNCEGSWPLTACAVLHPFSLSVQVCFAALLKAVRQSGPL